MKGRAQSENLDFTGYVSAKVFYRRDLVLARQVVSGLAPWVHCIEGVKGPDRLFYHIGLQVLSGLTGRANGNR